jgi:tRNA1Val (adenine37-N6)-methyltransferase
MGKHHTAGEKKFSRGLSERSEPRYDAADGTVWPTDAETLDVLFDGRLRVLQSRKGYRFSLDALLLAYFASPRGTEKVVDLGSGSGVVSLILAKFYPNLAVTGLELQETLAARAQRSARLNGLESRVRILQGDVRTISTTLPPGGADLVVANPPFRRAGSGRMSPDPERMIARHEIKAELTDFLRAAAYVLANKGRLVLIFLASRLGDLLQAMRSVAIEPKRLRFVHSRRGEEASLVLVEGLKGGRKEQKILAPLVVYEDCDNYTPEVAGIISGEISKRDRRSQSRVSPAGRKIC